jgi:hypothetical protein
MLGLFPEPGIGKLKSALPLFSITTVCTALVEPTFVVAKFSAGAVVRSILINCDAVVPSGTKTLPAGSTVTPYAAKLVTPGVAITTADPFGATSMILPSNPTM